MTDYSGLCSVLPDNVNIPNISICKNREQAVTDFLENTLPSSDCKHIPDTLRKTFVFSKFRIKRRQKMDCRNTSVSTKKKSEPHVSKHLSNISFKNQLKYNEVYPLNRLWLSYIKNLLGITSFTNIPKSPDDPNWENINQQLMKADFHGANITIYKSRCASLVGLTGIVVQDTKKTFKICGTDNYIRMIPKDVVIIRIHMDDNITLEVYGKQLGIRPVERAVRKFKNMGLTRL